MLHETVPPSVAALIRDVREWPLPVDTYMAGGTAVAIYLNHRVSLDIDLFTEKEFFCGPIISSIEQNHTISVTNAADRDTLLAIVDNIRFSLFNYPYPLIKTLVYNPDYKINLASPEDIAAMKIVAIAQRGIAKDFIDLRALIETYGILLNDLIIMVQEKYRVSEEYGYQIKRSLVYFDDAVKSLGDVTILRNNQRVRLNTQDWKNVQEFFEGLVLG